MKKKNALKGGEDIQKKKKDKVQGNTEIVAVPAVNLSAVLFLTLIFFSGEFARKKNPPIRGVH